MTQPVSLVKQGGADQSGDDLDACPGSCGRSGGCPPEGLVADDISDAGMSTVEYAVGTVVAAAFAAVLYQIVTGDSVVSGLTDLIDRALSTAF